MTARDWLLGLDMLLDHKTLNEFKYIQCWKLKCSHTTITACIFQNSFRACSQNRKKVQNQITAICPSVSSILVRKLQLITGHLHAAATMCSTLTHMKKKCLTEYLKQILKNCFHILKFIQLEEPQQVEHTVIISLRYYLW